MLDRSYWKDLGVSLFGIIVVLTDLLTADMSLSYLLLSSFYLL